ncbi:MAG TPA: ABC transporter permease, partial [Bryobacteraceae bacterium]|nr:ABC transporter permease [Bryobacteraceae bacterium]
MSWTRFFRRRDWDQERSREIDAYLQIETDENIARGMSPDDARYTARKKLGNPTQIREEIYRMNSLGLLETIAQDMRYALRQLRRSPGFTAAAVLSLALGIGANTAVFTLLDQVLLRQLPVRDPKQLVLLTWEGANVGPNISSDVVSYPLYKDFRDQNQVFSGLLCYHAMDFGIGYKGQTERVRGELVTGNYFETLGVQPALGRLFTADDDRIPGGHPLVVLSYDYWIDRFHGDRGVLGQTVRANGAPLTVIGVSAKGFGGLEVGRPAEIRVPITMRSQVTPASWTEMFGLDKRRGHWVRVVGRLKPGISWQHAKASMQPIFHSILEMEVQQKEFAITSSDTRRDFLKSWVNVLPIARGRRSGVRDQFDTPLSMLMAIVGFVLLIACANVANLLLARATGREREIAVRLALGAGRARIVRQSLVESVLLAFLGGGVGLLIASWTDQLLTRVISAAYGPLGLTTTPDLRILGFTLAICTITGILFGLAPALGTTHVDLVPALKEHSGALTGGAHARLRRLLVVSQVCLSVLLLIGAGLYLRTLVNLRTLNPGFNTHNVVALALDPSLNGYSAERRIQMFHDALDKLRATPGVESAGLGLVRPIDDDWWGSDLTIEGYQPKSGAPARAAANGVSPGYLATLGIPLLAGRDFSASDAGSKHKVALVNATFAQKYFGATSPIGRRFGFGANPGTKTDTEIVGVVRDSKYSTMRERPLAQIMVDSDQMDGIFHASLFVSSRLDPRQMYSGIRHAIQQVDSTLPIVEMRTMHEQLVLELMTDRLVASLATVFGLLAT